MQGSEKSSVRSSTDVMGPTLASISKQRMTTTVSHRQSATWLVCVCVCVCVSCLAAISIRCLSHFTSACIFLLSRAASNFHAYMHVMVVVLTHACTFLTDYTPFFAEEAPRCRVSLINSSPELTAPQMTALSRLGNSRHVK
jgi:hypothetical protein